MQRQGHAKTAQLQAAHRLAGCDAVQCPNVLLSHGDKMWTTEETNLETYAIRKYNA